MINFGEIKRTVPPIEAATRYGLVKHGFMRCPFHADKTPSLKLYGDHFHCFGCGAHGDGNALAPKSTGDAIADGYAEACTLDAWAGYLLDTGASRDEMRLVEQKTARLMEGLRG